MGHDHTVDKWECLSVDLSAADDKALFKVCFFCNFECLFERACHCHVLSSVETTGYDDIDTAWESAADRLEGLAAHDDRATDCGAPEEAQIFGNMPQELVVASYGIIV